MTKNEMVSLKRVISILTAYEAPNTLIDDIKALPSVTLKDNVVSREAVLAPYKELKDDDVISVWLIKKNIEQLPSVTPICEEREKGECSWYAG